MLRTTSTRMPYREAYASAMSSFTVIMQGMRFMHHRSSASQTCRFKGLPVNPAASVKYSWLSYTTGNCLKAMAGHKVSRSFDQMADNPCPCSFSQRRSPSWSWR